MKFTTTIDINSPIDKVIALFDNPDNMSQWMEGLQSFQHLSGTPGQPGAKSKLRFKMGKREVEMIETVTVRNLPHEFTGTYEANGVFNIVKNKFVKVSEDKTRYITENEFQFKGFMKLIALLMPGAFKKQSMKFLQHFKEFAEKENH
ncbi:SRPBCC family protein [Polluticaenibacter yanchengensis]|uniref:SRPBCC family protein n=1 Tax=Polluticaenibacter yanchengensis TaxID=3014562 RepID=A0ABT4UG32_9BACT|nr:SRPBCC family protein [Chitinophagaceae bacterium LY-5]